MRLPLAICVAIAGNAAAQDCIWNPVPTPGAVPDPRNSAGIAYDSARARVVLFGGTSGNGNFGDTWEWDGASWTLVSTTGPKPRYSHAMAFHAGLNKTLMVGGLMAPPLDTHTWQWDGASWTQLPGDNYTYTPYGAAMVYDAAHARMIMYGGTVSISGQPPTRECDPTGLWGAISIPGPAALTNCAAAYDPDRARIILFGGRTTSPFGTQRVYGETWEFDGFGSGSWTQVPSGPLARFGASMCYDPGRRRMILTSGIDSSQNSTILGDAWDYDPVAQAWAHRTDDGPGQRAFASFIFDAAHSAALQFGGQIIPGGASSNDLWRYDGANTHSTFITQSPQPATIAAGYPYSLTVAATGATGYQWYRETTPLVDGGNISGATTATLTMNPVAPNQSGFYRVLVTGGCGNATAGAYISIFDPSCYSNCDHSTATPHLNANDFQCFLNKYAAGDSYANCDFSTIPPVLNANDFQCFLGHFAAGC